MLYELKKKAFQLLFKSLKGERDKRLTPKPEMDQYFGTAPGIQFPETTPSLQLVKYVHNTSPTLKIATMRLRETIFRRGFEWEAKFIRKCTVCDTEFDENIEVCEECGGRTEDPDKSEQIIGNNFFKNCGIEGYYKNRNLQHLLKQIEDDINVYDDAYIIGIKEYWQDAEGGYEFATLHEIIRGDPIKMRIVANEYAELGGMWWTCLRHRDQIHGDLNQKCPICNRKLYEIHYVSTSGESPEAYYTGDEVIHVSKYRPSELYGFSPIVTLWHYTLTLTNMMEYIYKSYTEQHLPKGILAMKTSNPQSAAEFWQDVDDKLLKDPHYIPKMFLEGEGSGTGSGVEFVRFMDTLEEMQYIPIRNELRQAIAALYGITNIFMGDTAGIGGLNAEDTQIQITNMAAESSLAIYNDIIMITLMDWLNIEDWIYKLNSPFETDNKRELDEELMRANIAEKMLMMGFDVKLDQSTGEFKYTGEAKKPEMGGMPGMGGGSGGYNGYNNGEDNYNLGKENHSPGKHKHDGYDYLHPIDRVHSQIPERVPRLEDQLGASRPEDKYPTRFEETLPTRFEDVYPNRPKGSIGKKSECPPGQHKHPDMDYCHPDTRKHRGVGYKDTENHEPSQTEDQYGWLKEKNINFIRNKVPENMRDIGDNTNKSLLIDENIIDNTLNKTLKRISPYLKGKNIYRTPKDDRSADGFTISRKENLNDIFIPRYNKEKFNELNENPKDIKGLANEYTSMYNKNKKIQEWKNRVQEADVETTLEKTILHERCHLTVFNLLFSKNNNEKDITYQVHPELLFDIFKDYMKLPMIEAKLYGYWNNNLSDEQNNGRLGMILGEFIAEDMRLMYVNTKQSKIFPHFYFYDGDLITSESEDININTAMKRQTILRNILHVNGINTDKMFEDW